MSYPEIYGQYQPYTDSFSTLSTLMTEEPYQPSYESIYPAASAPALEESDLFSMDGGPTVVVSPVENQHRAHGAEVYGYTHLIPIVQPLNDFQERANQAYLRVWPDLQRMVELPPLNVDKSSIQTLKQIEKSAKQGIISTFLHLLFKVLQVVSRLALGIAVGFTVAVIISAMCGLPLAAVLCAIGAGGLFLGAGFCKLISLLFHHVKTSWIEKNFTSSLQEERNEFLHLKTWKQIKEWPHVEQRLKDALQHLHLAQQHVGYLDLRAQQIIYLQVMLNKIKDFQTMENQLDDQKSMPLLHRFLNN